MTFTNSLNGFDGAQELLIKLVEQSPEDWETRKRVVQVLYDSGLYRDASKLVWNAPEIPPITEDVVFTARVVAMGQPARAVRLVSTMIESNQDTPEENFKVAKALVKEGLVLQALRFYGAATAGDPSLIDENFELALVNADCGDENWRDVAEGEEFPWEGPQGMSITDMMDGDASAAEMLLSSVTQRVPLKALAKNSSVISESAPVSQDVASSPVKTPKPMLSPAAEALVKQQAESSRVAVGLDGATSPEQANEDGSFSSLVNFFKHKEMEQGQEMEPEKKAPPVKSQPLATIATSVDTRAQTSVEGPAPSSPLIQGFQPRPSDALKQVVPEVVVAPAEAQIPDPAPAPEVEPVAEVAPEGVFQPSRNKAPAEAPTAAVFSNHEPVAMEPEPEIEEPNDFAGVTGLAATEPLVEDIAPPVTPPVAVYEEPAPVQAEQPIDQEEDLSDAVASALAERDTSQPESQDGGFFAKIKGVFSRSKSDKEIEVQDEVVSSEVAAEPAAPIVPEQATMPDAAAPQPVSVESPVPVPEAAEPVAPEASNPSGQARAISSPVSTTVLRKPEQDQHEPPRELDGRTQLVALAPQDGSVFFDQLSAKYTNVPAGQLPPAALVARDMANVDYVQLIREACSKDLNAFSKLLGLHRVMTESDCSAWVEDMDLLRKGYGDAVLATVVSKYSVAECREILGAVYQRPRDQAVAG